MVSSQRQHNNRRATQFFFKKTHTHTFHQSLRRLAFSLSLLCTFQCTNLPCPRSTSSPDVDRVRVRLAHQNVVPRRQQLLQLRLQPLLQVAALRQRVLAEDHGHAAHLRRQHVVVRHLARQVHVDTLGQRHDRAARPGADGDGRDGRRRRGARAEGHAQVLELQVRLHARHQLRDRRRRLEARHAARPREQPLLHGLDRRDRRGLQPVGQPVVDAARGAVERGVRRVDRHAVRDGVQQQHRLVVRQLQRLHAAEDGRVVRDERADLLLQALLHHGLRVVDGEHHVLCLTLQRGLHHDAHVVPRGVRKLQRRDRLHRTHNRRKRTGRGHRSCRHVCASERPRGVGKQPLNCSLNEVQIL
eukprot:Rhum_TRINITY_DN5853_c0_g1::Rhum_TRINITY_DN5853_c0_g1_i1::g.18439::m.18439